MVQLGTPTVEKIVLVVGRDGEAELRLDDWPSVEAALTEAGLAVERVSTAQVLERARREPTPRLILLGGGEERFEALSELRADPLTQELPIVVLVDRQDEAQMPRAFELGADDFLARPVRRMELLARLGAQLRLHGYMQEIALERQDAQVMLELTQTLASSLDFHEILYTVVRRIAELVQVDRVSIVLTPEGESEDVGYVVVTSDDEELTNLRLDLSKYPEIKKVLSTREPLTIHDASTHPLLDAVRGSLPDQAAHAMSLFPIVWESHATGVLFLRSSAGRGALSDRETHVCQIVSNATAVALRNARVMQSLRDQTQQVTFARYEAEQRLESLKRYADLFSSAAEGIAVLDTSGHLLFANPRAHEIVGYSAEALKGRMIRELLHPDSAERAAVLWERFRQGELARGVDLEMVRQDGETIVIRASIAQLTEGEGALLMSFQDVTDDRRTERELVRTMQFLESLIDASVDGIVAADLSGHILLFNEAAERMYGYRTEEVIGRLNARALYPGNGAQRVMRMLRSEQHGGMDKLEPTRLEAQSKTGERIPIRLSAAMIYEKGVPSATFGIFTDLRDRLRVEERLAEATQKLASSEKQALIAELAGTAAHELNQPLTSIMAYAQLLERKLPEDTSEARAARTMVEQAQRMADIVKKIGKMTKYETKFYVGGQKILDLDRSSPDADEDAGRADSEPTEACADSDQEGRPGVGRAQPKHERGPPSRRPRK
ncbi:MAG: PAS domain S-box protein [Deltaproteobacteria bacterium]|nr:PAS domain S-box protein [Deltaproteobacteria bacterium]